MPGNNRARPRTETESRSASTYRMSRRLNAEGIKRNVIVIGASAGGIAVLLQLLKQLPVGFSAAIAIVLHRGTKPSQLCTVLGRPSALPVIEPTRDVPLRKGMIYLAPPDHHMEIGEGRVLVHRGPKEHSTRPAVDPLFRSAATVYGPRVIGLLLSGCGDDGVAGMVSIKAEGGLCLVQDPSASAMPYMPMNAIRYDHVDRSLTPDAMAPVLMTLAGGGLLNGSHPHA